MHEFYRYFANTKALSEFSNSSKAELTLSLDVIYHLIEDSVFDEYMTRLFDAADVFVIIYSSNTNDNYSSQAPHVMHRKFTDWTDENLSNWTMVQHIPNRHRYDKNIEGGTCADFFIYKKKQ